MIQEQLPAVWRERWDAQQFTAPSAIQTAVFTPLKEKESVVGISPTGSGKTLAYLWPLLMNVDVKAGHQLLILTSSQELAMQVTQIAKIWAADLGLRVQPLIGGANVKRQIDKLKEKAEIIVGTPGRVSELMKQKKLKAHQFNTVVLDEADQLVAEGTVQFVRQALQGVPNTAQFAFFSATADSALQEIEALVPQKISVIDATATDQSKGIVRHVYLNYPQRRLVDSLRRLGHLEGMQALVFFNQLADLGSAEEKLLFHGLPVGSLASDQGKEIRKTALQLFKDGKLTELLTTDVAARGIDIAQLPYVVNTEVPLTNESYIHRSGRVGRMGADGVVLTIVQDHTLKDLKKMAKQLDIELEEVYLHSGALVLEKPEIVAEPTPTPRKKTQTPTTSVEAQPTFEETRKPVKKKKVKTKNKKNKGARRPKN